MIISRYLILLNSVAIAVNILMCVLGVQVEETPLDTYLSTELLGHRNFIVF